MKKFISAILIGSAVLFQIHLGNEIVNAAEKKPIVAANKYTSGPLREWGRAPITINYNLPIQFLIRKGEFKSLNNPAVFKNFQTARRGEVNLTLELYSSTRTVTSEEVIQDLKRLNLRPAEFHELLVFGIKYPEVQSYYDIVALGSVWLINNGSSEQLAVPYIFDSEYFGRGLNIIFFNQKWHRSCLFAAIKETKK